MSEMIKELWEVSNKLLAIAEIIKNQKPDTSYSEYASLGLGDILDELSARIRIVKDQLEETS